MHKKTFKHCGLHVLNILENCSSGERGTHTEYTILLIIN
jgi:hypothetical protein